MTGFRQILLSLSFGSVLQATPLTDPYVKNLTLVGVIHVQGVKTKGQSVAVLREKSTGKTRILHKGDSILEAALEVRELGPQQITLGRGQQTFILRVENFPDNVTTLSHDVESMEVELADDKSSRLVELPLESVSNQITPLKSSPTEERRLFPDVDCMNEECPALDE